MTDVKTYITESRPDGYTNHTFKDNTTNTYIIYETRVIKGSNTNNFFKCYYDNYNANATTEQEDMNEYVDMFES